MKLGISQPPGPSSPPKPPTSTPSLDRRSAAAHHRRAFEDALEHARPPKHRGDQPGDHTDTKQPQATDTPTGDESASHASLERRLEDALDHILAILLGQPSADHDTLIAAKGAQNRDGGDTPAARKLALTRGALASHRLAVESMKIFPKLGHTQGKDGRIFRVGAQHGDELSGEKTHDKPSGEPAKTNHVASNELRRLPNLPELQITRTTGVAERSLEARPPRMEAVRAPSPAELARHMQISSGDRWTAARAVIDMGGGREVALKLRHHAGMLTVEIDAAARDISQRLTQRVQELSRALQALNMNRGELHLDGSMVGEWSNRDGGDQRQRSQRQAPAFTEDAALHEDAPDTNVAGLTRINGQLHIVT